MPPIYLSKVSAFHMACGSGDVQTVVQYLQGAKSEFIGGKKVMPFHLDPSGASGLSSAAMAGQLPVAMALLQVKTPPGSEADLNGKSKAGATALMYAAEGGHVDMVRLLLTHNPNLAALNKAGETVLHYAARNENKHTKDEIMAILKAAGVDSSVKNQAGQTADDLALQPTQDGARAEENSAQANGTEELTNQDIQTTAKIVEEKYVDEQGRQMKKTLDLSQATWDDLGRRVMPETTSRDGKETSKERNDRRKEAKRRQKMEEEEMAYIESTGDKNGFQGFVKVGDKVLTKEQQILKALSEMGFDEDHAEKAFKETKGVGVAEAVEWATANPPAVKPSEVSNQASNQDSEEPKPLMHIPNNEEPGSDHANSTGPVVPPPFNPAAQPMLPPAAFPPQQMMPPLPFAHPPFPQPPYPHPPLPQGMPLPPQPFMPPAPIPTNPMHSGLAPGVLAANAKPLSPNSSAAAGKQLLEMFAQGGDEDQEEQPGNEAGKILLDLFSQKFSMDMDDEDAEKDAEGKKGFATDTEISATGYKERALQKFEFDGMEATDDSIEHFNPQKRKEGFEDANLDGGLEEENGEGWDQFKANEKTFGVSTSYSEDFYTTKLDKSKLTKEQAKKAAALAAQIEAERGGKGDELEIGGDDSWATDVCR